MLELSGALIENQVIHLVLMSVKITPEYNFVPNAMPTGVFSEDGAEQGFLHINFRDNIKVTSSKLLK